MRLIGSTQEQNFRKELIESHTALFQKGKNKRILNILKANFNEMKTAYIINWVPEQGEDFYTILVDLNIIVKVEIGRYNHDEEPIIEIFKLQEYEKGLSKVSQIKLAVAMDLARIDIGSNDKVE
jgi:hypothetical protein